MTDPGLALCLSSAFFGHYAHAGFLTGLAERGIHPGRIAGSSAGAIAGGLWAAGIRGQELEAVLFSLKFKRSFFDLGAFRRVFGVASWMFSPGILAGTRMDRYLSDLLGDLRMEDCSPRIEIAVANLTRGLTEVRRQGLLREFIIASFAMPIIYRPRRIDGEDFLDGGVANETPFDHWARDPQIHTILVHRIAHAGSIRSHRSPGGVISSCHALISRELFERRRREAEVSGKRLIVVETSYPHPGTLHRSATGRKCFAAGVTTAAELAITLNECVSSGERFAMR